MLEEARLSHARDHAVARALFLALFFVSGFTALIYQIVWQRVLTLFTGADLESVTLVVAAFMAGLGFGSLAGGQLADRLGARGRLFALAIAEFAIAAFALAAALRAKPGLSAADLAGGKPRLVNIFASWCVPCIGEVKVLQALKARGVAIDGIAVRDRAEDVADFLARNGDPYERIGSDPQSGVQISLGSSGVPESFVVDGRGVIRYQHIGAIEQADVPLIMAKLEDAK